MSLMCYLNKVHEMKA